MAMAMATIAVLKERDSEAKKMHKVSKLILALLLLWPALALADFQAGVEALKRGEFAAALGEFRPLAKTGDANAQNLLGFMYANGFGLPADDQQALKWYRLAAEQGQAKSQYSLGVMYANGIGVPADLAEAVTWFRLSADQGDASAQSNLGVMYKNAQGVAQDKTEAARWFHRAAMQGDTTAQHNLAGMYYVGEGVPEDYVRAYAWITLASAKGEELAMRGKDIIRQRMTPAQIVDSQKVSYVLCATIPNCAQ